MVGQGAIPVTDTFIPGPDNARAFRDALGCFSTGVTVVTCQTPSGPLGITANSFSSVSMDPPLVLWSPAKASRRYQPFIDARHFTIHIIGHEQGDIASGFARDGAAFDGLGWVVNAEGAPVIPGCLAHFECETAALHDAGDHTIIVGHVLRAARRHGEPLLFALGEYGRFMGSKDP